MLNYRIILTIITYLKLNRLKANCSPGLIDYMINKKYVKKTPTDQQGLAHLCNF